MASQDSDRLEVMVIEAEGLLPVEGTVASGGAGADRAVGNCIGS